MIPLRSAPSILRRDRRSERSRDRPTRRRGRKAHARRVRPRTPFSGSPPPSLSPSPTHTQAPAKHAAPARRHTNARSHALLINKIEKRQSLLRVPRFIRINSHHTNAGAGALPRGVGINCLVALEREAWRIEIPRSLARRAQVCARRRRYDSEESTTAPPRARACARVPCSIVSLTHRPRGAPIGEAAPPPKRAAASAPVASESPRAADLPDHVTISGSDRGWALTHTLSHQAWPVLCTSGVQRLPLCCFLIWGPAAIRPLHALAGFELAQHDDWLAQPQGLDPLVDPSARAQYRHHCFRQALLASATPSPRPPSCAFWPPHPLPPLPSRDLLARNRPGPADPVFAFPSHFSPDSLIASCSHPLSPAGTLPLIHPFPSGSAFFDLRVSGRRSFCVNLQTYYSSPMSAAADVDSELLLLMMRLRLLLML